MASENPNAQVMVRAVRFSNGAQWHIAQSTPVAEFRWDDLSADGVTDMGKALQLVAEQLDPNVMPRRALPPVLVLISDGKPTDDFSGGLRALMDSPWGKKAVRIAIAIGDDADKDTLQRFISHPELEPLRITTPKHWFATSSGCPPRCCSRRLRLPARPWASPRRATSPCRPRPTPTSPTPTMSGKLPGARDAAASVPDGQSTAGEGVIWQALGASVPGASHLRTNRPNQDALRRWPRSGQGSTLILAIADGHGGARYARSHIGAALAVRVAVQVLSRDLRDFSPNQDDLDLSQLKRDLEGWLPKILVRRWQERVQRHLRRYPLTPDEETLLTTPATDGKPAAVRSGLHAYGATLLAVLVTPQFHLYVQLGDGDILTVSADGRVSAPPLAEDSRLLANETTSLCMAEAWTSVRLYFQPVVSALPALIVLATDGYANSFVDADAFAQVGADLLSAVQTQGVDSVNASLPAWLADTSSSGSGDDITVAMAYRQG
ncbi:MAG: protein phosphatase 2C domain-containing protein [Caldilineaceae bacterium]